MLVSTKKRGLKHGWGFGVGVVGVAMVGVGVVMGCGGVGVGGGGGGGQEGGMVGVRSAAPETGGDALGTPVAALGKSALVIYQAKDGAYWFGSDGEGVFRSAQEQITRFTTADGLAGDRVRGIQEDTAGNIYVTTMGGISKFDGKSFVTLKAEDGGTGAWKIEPDDLWFASVQGQRGVYRYDGVTLHHLELPRTRRAQEHYAQFPDRTYFPDEVYFIYKDRKGHLWIGTAALGVCRFDGTTWEWLYEHSLTENAVGGSFGIRAILEDRAGSFWICNASQRYTVLPREEGATAPADQERTLRVKKEAGIPGLRASDGDHLYFFKILEDAGGDLWMVTYREGVLRFDGKTVRRYPIRKDGKDVTAFTLMQDRNGTMWVGTHEAGVMRFNGETFEPFKPAVGVAEPK